MVQGSLQWPSITLIDVPAKGNTLTVDEIARLAALAQEVGARWFGVTDFPYYYDVVPTMTTCLAATETLVVESLVTTPYARHPEATACAFATMNDFSGGRVVLGIGGGVEAPSNVYVEPWGRARPQPLRATRELVDICRRMWAGTSSPTDGQVLRASGLTLKFPLRYPVTILIAARGPRMLELAGELDIVHIAAPFLGTDYITGALTRIRSGAHRAARKPGDVEIDLTVSACIMDDGELARSLARLTTGAGLLWTSGGEKYTQLRSEWSVPDELDVPDALITKLARTWDMWGGEDLPAEIAAMMDDHVLDQFSVAGSPPACIARLRELVERFPEVTGLRFKLPPVGGPDSYHHYVAMFQGVDEVRRLWGA